MPQHPHDSRGLRSTSNPPNAGEPLHVFDLLLVPASGLPVADEERQAHPPVRRPSVRLADGLTIGAFDGDLAELVMNACEFRGHFYFTTANRPGGRYAYVLNQPVTAAFTSGWDPDELIRLAVALSRYVRDNADSGQYAARVTEYSGGEVRIMPYDCMELRHVYRMSEEERDWLDAGEAEELAELISAFRAVGELPERVGQAFWKVEHTAWERYLDVVQPAMVSALEGLLSTSREQLTGNLSRVSRSSPSSSASRGSQRRSAGGCTTRALRASTAEASTSSSHGRDAATRSGRSHSFRPSCAPSSAARSRTRCSVPCSMTTRTFASGGQSRSLTGAGGGGVSGYRSPLPWTIALPRPSALSPAIATATFRVLARATSAPTRRSHPRWAARRCWGR